MSGTFRRTPSAARVGAGLLAATLCSVAPGCGAGDRPPDPVVLARGLDGPSPRTRLESARALVAAGPAPDLLAAVASGPWLLRVQAVDVLGRRSPLETGAVAAALDDPDWRVRAAAVAALRAGAVVQPAVVEPLRDALEDGDARVRAAAARALVDAGPGAAPAAGTLAALLADPDATTRRQATRALVAIGPAAIPVLIRAREAGGVAARRYAGWALRRLAQTR